MMMNTASGVLILAHDRLAARYMSSLFEKRHLKKSYIAILRGHLDTSSLPIKVDLPIGDDLASGGVRMKCFSQEHMAKVKALKEAKLLQYKQAQKAFHRSSHNHELDLPAVKMTETLEDCRAAETHIYPLLRTYLRRDLPVTVVLLRPITGRRHQLRVHCCQLGHPILGDWTYEGPKKETELGRMWLHAWEIAGTLKKPDGLQPFLWTSKVPWEDHQVEGYIEGQKAST